MCQLVDYADGKVADMKLRHVMNIAENAVKATNIHKIMLFGSSIEERCTEQSDIDIAVFGEKAKGTYIDSQEFRTFKRNIFRFDWDQDYDILYFKEKDHYKDAIMEDISHGVEIYRRPVV